MRINKYIASCGIASRRKAEELILENRVKVNGKVINELSLKIDEKNVVAYRIKDKEELIVIFNGNQKSVNIELPEGVWGVLVNNLKSGKEIIEEVYGKVIINRKSAFIVKKIK